MLVTHNKIKVSIILSIYNESFGLKSFWSTLENELSALQDFIFEILWINDGSTDASQKVINKIVTNSTKQNINHLRIRFSKNFGHEAAMIAGIDNSSGHCIICMDADGQHPTTAIKHLINAYQKGNQIVLTQRKNRNETNFSKRIFSSFFYKLINYLSTIKFQKNASDFFLISKEIGQILRVDFRDQTRFIRGFIQSLGYQKITLEYDANNRINGESNYTNKKLLKLALDAIFSSSSKPLRISISVSFIFILFTLILLAYTLYNYFLNNTAPSGYNTIIIFLSTSFSILFFSLGVISLYFEKLIKETQKRPLYIIESKQ